MEGENDAAYLGQAEVSEDWVPFLINENVCLWNTSDMIIDAMKKDRLTAFMSPWAMGGVCECRSFKPCAMRYT